MTVLDRPTERRVTAPAIAEQPSTNRVADLRCVVCHRTFDFAAGQSALILKHIAYGYDFAHDGPCLTTARSWIFVDPDYDRPAFSTDGQRHRVVSIANADGWVVALPNAPELVEAGKPVTYEPVRFWALVEYRDGHRQMEGVIRADEWLDETGAAEFPEARTGRRASLGYRHQKDAD
jgi:hypothetical protein